MLELLEAGDGAKDSGSESAGDVERAAAPESELRCATCGTGVALERDRIHVGPEPAVFANPHGRVFVLSTFARARVLALGEPASEFSWYPGYAWQVAVCRGCGQHLGWRFVSEGGAAMAVFFGLLADHLLEGPG